MKSVMDEFRKLIASGIRLDGWVIIFDTLKKCGDLMSKKGTADLMQFFRNLSGLGATVVLLAHTNKHKQDGKFVFEGVGDIRNDCDDMVFLVVDDILIDGTYDLPTLCRSEERYRGVAPWKNPLE